MVQHFSAMLGTLAIQDANVSSHPPATYLNMSNYSQQALTLLMRGKGYLQGPELSGKEMHGCILRAAGTAHHRLHSVDT
jgi:hypothetical protein